MLTVRAGAALCNRLLQSHTLGKGSGLTALNMYEGQGLISEHFVLTTHRRDIFLLNKEIHARGLPSMELTVGWGTEVHSWTTSQKTKAVISGWIIEVGEILKAAFVLKNNVSLSVCTADFTAATTQPQNNVCLILKMEVGLKQRHARGTKMCLWQTSCLKTVKIHSTGSQPFARHTQSRLGHTWGFQFNHGPSSQFTS